MHFKAFMIYEVLSDVKYSDGSKTYSPEDSVGNYSSSVLWKPENQSIIKKAGYKIEIIPSKTVVKKGFFFDSKEIIPEMITISAPNFIKNSNEVFCLDLEKQQVRERMKQEFENN